MDREGHVTAISTTDMHSDGVNWISTAFASSTTIATFRIHTFNI